MKTSDIPESVRAEMDGKAAESKTFAVWMNELSNAEQDRLFGESAAQRWRDDTITQTELLRQARRPLSVESFASASA